MGQTLVRYHNISPEAIAALLGNDVSVDPTNLKRDVARTALNIANICRAGKKSMMGLMVDSFEDDSGIDPLLSDRNIFLSNGKIFGQLSTQFDSFDPELWTLSGVASYDSANKCVMLTPAQTHVTGALVLNRSVNPWNFETRFSIWAGGGTGADFIALIFAEEGSINYVIEFNEYIGNTIRVFDSGTRLAEVTTPFNLDDGTWREAVVKVLNGRLTVSLAGQQFIDLQLPQRRNYYGFRFYSFCGGLTNIHRIDNITISIDLLVVSTQIACASTPNYVTLFPNDHSGFGGITYYVSRDDGNTWTQVQPGVEADLSSQPLGNILRIKAELAGNAYIDGWALMWR